MARSHPVALTPEPEDQDTDSPPVDLELSVEKITPELAGDWLAHNTHNRPLREAHVQEIARALEAGEWRLNGETIKFNSRGDLVDGQYRLNAIVMANRPAWSVIVRAAPNEAFETIDSGKRRSLGDALALAGETNCETLAATITLHWRFLHRQMIGAIIRPTTATGMAHLAEHPELRQAVLLGSRAAHKARCQPSLAAVAWYLFQQRDREAANDFLLQLAEGAGLSPNDPIYRLRERFINNRDARLKLSQAELLALTIKAWNYWRLGRETTTLAWRFRGGEPYPEVQG